MKIAIIVAAVVAITGSLAFAAYTEHQTDPQAQYALINHQYFHDQLPAVVIRVLPVTAVAGETWQQEDGVIVIQLDKTADLGTLKHETCHAATIDEPLEHGPLFDACMLRYKQ